MKTKICNYCKLEKNTSDFYFRNSSKKLDAYCKSCRSIKSKEYYKKNSNKVKKVTKKYWSNNKEKHYKLVERYHTEHPEVSRYYALKASAQSRNVPFNLTLDEYRILTQKPIKCFSTGEKLSLNIPWDTYISRLHMNEEYRLNNMEVTNKDIFYDKLQERHLDLLEEIEEKIYEL